MRVLLYGKKNGQILPLVQKAGLKLVEENPELVLAYGGDGVLMKAEYEFPGVPKTILKGSLVCKRCPPYPNEVILEKVKAGDFKIEEIAALEVFVNNSRLRGINDIIIHNKDYRHAIRYELWINSKKMAHEIIGDGIVAATPYGSTGYYRSITASFFEVGLGLAFNNSTEQFNHMVLQAEAVIKVKITRGPAVVFADNQKDFLELGDGGEAVIQKSKAVARLLTFS